MAEGPAEDLDALVRRVDPDRWLASRFIADREKRADVIALYAFDYELRRAAEATSNPIMCEIRLAWWSEALDEIYGGAPVRRHPTAEALAQAVGRRALPRGPLDRAVESRLGAFDNRAGALDAAGAITEAAALLLDPDADREAARSIGRASARGPLSREAKVAARRLSHLSFPAVAHAALADREGSGLRKRLRLTWAVASGRL